jgi:hypothetical protein
MEETVLDNLYHHLQHLLSIITQILSAMFGMQPLRKSRISAPIVMLSHCVPYATLSSAQAKGSVLLIPHNLSSGAFHAFDFNRSISHFSSLGLVLQEYVMLVLERLFWMIMLHGDCMKKYYPLWRARD